MQPSDARQKNLNLRLAEINNANSKEETAMVLKAEKIKQRHGAKQSSIKKKTIKGGL